MLRSALMVGLLCGRLAAEPSVTLESLLDSGEAAWRLATVPALVCRVGNWQEDLWGARQRAGLPAPEPDLEPELAPAPPPEGWEAAPLEVRPAPGSPPPRAAVSLGPVETEVQLQPGHTTWRARLARSGIQATVRGSLTGWSASWREYDVECVLRLWEGLTFGAGVTRRVQADNVESSGRGSLRWSF